MAHCVPGSYSRTGLIPCKLCEIGTYQTASGSTSCSSCDEGTLTATTGSTADTDCKAHCVPGSYSRTGLVPCKLCEIGTYQTASGSTLCSSCDDGTLTATTGSTADTDCKAHCVAGSYSSTGFVPCIQCKIGTYQESTGSMSCTTCGTGTLTATTGSTSETDCTEVTDCGDISGTTSGVYKIKHQGVEEPFSVYCDIQTEGGGWTVFQRRQDGSVDFYRDWASYETGFGDMMGEFWLGNHFIHSITNQGSYELRVNLSDFEGNSAYAHYNVFSVGDASSKYLLAVSGYSGNAGDSLGYLNTRPFSTHDRDHDGLSGNCAVQRKGAWWYRGCSDSNLNGKYHHQRERTSGMDGVFWYRWKGFRYSLKSTTMSVRRSRLS
ncbi:hypothetical protein ScPMuIL_010738 [Solemya velum]